MHWVLERASLNCTLRPASHLPFDAEATGVIDDALAHPGNGLCGPVRGVAEDSQSGRVECSFANPVDSCVGKERSEVPIAPVGTPQGNQPNGPPFPLLVGASVEWEIADPFQCLQLQRTVRQENSLRGKTQYDTMVNRRDLLSDASRPLAP